MVGEELAVLSSRSPSDTVFRNSQGCRKVTKGREDGGQGGGLVS